MSQSTIQATSQQQQASTISNLIEQIQTSMMKLKYDDQESGDGMVRYHKKWSPEQRQTLARLVREYGSDFTYFKKFLPFKTRRQIQRRYQLQVSKDHKLHTLLQRQERKDRFDADILDYCPPVCENIKIKN